MSENKRMRGWHDEDDERHKKQWHARSERNTNPCEEKITRTRYTGVALNAKTETNSDTILHLLQRMVVNNKIMHKYKQQSDAVTQHLLYPRQPNRGYIAINFVCSMNNTVDSHYYYCKPNDFQLQ